MLRLLAGDGAVLAMADFVGVIRVLVAGFKFATRWAVDEGIAVICMGGIGADSFDFFGSVADSVYESSEMSAIRKVR